MDDSGTGDAAQSTTEGNGDGDAGDNNSWTVTTTDAAGGNCPAGGIFFSDGFESGDLSAWDTNTAGSGDSIAASTDQADTGTYSAKAVVNADASQWALVRKNFAGQTILYEKARIYLHASFSLTGTIVLAEIWENGNEIISTMIQDGTMRLEAYNQVASQSYIGTTAITTGVWHTIEMMTVISDTAGEFRIWLDGNLEIEQTGINLGTNPIDRADAGIGWEQAADPNTVYYDDVSLCVPTNSAVISGTVFEDQVGDVLNDGVIGDAVNPELQNVDVYLYTDDGDNLPDAADALSSGPVQTDAAGDYSFTGLADGTYWVVVDSHTVPSTIDAAEPLTNLWAEQTYGPLGGWCADGAGGTS